MDPDGHMKGIGKFRYVPTPWMFQLPRHDPLELGVPDSFWARNGAGPWTMINKPSYFNNKEEGIMLYSGLVDH